MKLPYRLSVWFFLISILASSCLMLSKAYGDDTSDLSKEYNQVFADLLRTKIEHLAKGVTVKVFLKDGTSVIGKYENFVSYDDSVFILPDGKHGLFSDTAYDIRELEDIRIIKIGKV